MTDYTITTDFGAKDSLPSGNAAKVIKGFEFTTEFTNIKTAVNSKADTAGDTFTGAVTFDAAVTLNADVTFDTNTMFVDVSANRVGIGTTSPQKLLEVASNSSPTVRISNTRNDALWNTDPVFGALEFYSHDASGSGASVRSKIQAEATTEFGNATDLVFYSGDSQGVATEGMRLSYNGRLGLGTDEPAYRLHIKHSDNELARFESTDLTSFISIKDSTATSRIQNISGKLSLEADSGSEGADSRIDFKVDGSERMRIDSSGNVLVGKTALNTNTTGLELHNQGLFNVCRDDAIVARFNRKTGSGGIIELRKDNAVMGNLGAGPNNYFYIGNGDTNIAFSAGSNLIFPRGTEGAQRDAAIDLGNGSNRFKDIYANNGTIQTSDRNEKQGIRELLDAEQRVATACKGLLRAFKWNSAVEEKGDEARIHFGIIAQDLQNAFTAEGLDAGDYAMFINSTWTDEETGEERSRMGVRYSELLAFIISAI